MQEDIAVKLAEVDARSRSNTHRLDNLEEKVDVLNRLATAVEVIASEQRNQGGAINEIKQDVTAIGKKVDGIEAKPGKRWEAIADKAIWAVCAAVIAFLLGRVGL